MVITAVSAYGCHQFVGFTISSWYGKMAADVLSFFLNHTDSTTLAQAVFLANQLLIEKTLSIDPHLLQVRVNGQTIDAEFQRDLVASGARVADDQVRDAVGLVLERDALVFFGDPARPAIVSSSRRRAPLAVTRGEDGALCLSAVTDFSGAAAILFPEHQGEIRSLPKGSVQTESFILFPSVKLNQGETLCLKP